MVFTVYASEKVPAGEIWTNKLSIGTIIIGARLPYITAKSVCILKVTEELPLGDWDGRISIEDSLKLGLDLKGDTIGIITTTTAEAPTIENTFLKWEGINYG